MTRRRTIVRLLRSGLIAVALWALPTQAQPETQPVPTGGADAPSAGDLGAAFERGDYGAARDIAEAQLRAKPKDPLLTYNLACALAMSGEQDAAAERLIDAISYGFVDFRYAERDPHLEPLRENAKYRLIIRAWRELLDARGKAAADAAQEALGPAYAQERDETMRLSFVWAMDPQSFAEAREELRRVTKWAEENVLGPEAMTSDDPARPDPWVLILMPTRRDFARLVGAAGVGGYYDRDNRRLVTQDIGPSLRHEFFHVLHWRHIDRLGQRHPLWIMEGLASLLEDVEIDAEGNYTLAPSWRTNIARRLDHANRLTPWRALFTMPRDGFMGGAARANYAQARCVFMFLHERGVLKDWYRAYVQNIEDDPTGAAAIEAVCGSPLKDVEAQYRVWLRSLPEVAEQARPGEVSLGFEVAPAVDGLLIAQTVAGSRARVLSDERPRQRDVITEINGQDVRTLDDLYRALSGAKPGDRVRLGIRRGARRLDVEMELVPRTAPGVLRDF